MLGFRYCKELPLWQPSSDVRLKMGVQMPNILQESSGGVTPVSLVDNAFQERKFFIDQEITAAYASEICRALMYFSSEDQETPATLFINSPGGSVASGLQIVDTMEAIACPVDTVCMGMAASMASIIFMAGRKGSRLIMPHARVLVHNPLTFGGGSGSALSVKKTADDLLETRETLADLMVKYTGQDKDEALRVMDEETTFDANEAIKWGIADSIVDRM